MLKSLWKLSACFVCSSAALFAIAPANAASVKAQAPCVYTNGVCASFDFDDVIPTISTYTFNMPTAGTALVMFNGTMLCVVGSNAANSDVIDLAGQIVTSAAAVADYTKPGGNRFAMRQLFKDFNFGPSTTMNLASTRAVKYNSGGSKSVFYKFNRLRMDSGTSCNIHAASFTVLITP